jgi:hypothetical protein
MSHETCFTVIFAKNFIKKPSADSMTTPQEFQILAQDFQNRRLQK